MQALYQGPIVLGWQERRQEMPQACGRRLLGESIMDQGGR
jgi:hypothetical protein